MAAISLDSLPGLIELGSAWVPRRVRDAIEAVGSVQLSPRRDIQLDREEPA